MTKGVPKGIWSGCQTGADQGGLEAAEALKIKTGGWVTHLCRTEEGDRPDLISRYGLTETLSHSYPPRTKLNVKDTSATLWIGNMNSPGGRLTIRTAKDYGKKYFVLPYGVSSFEADMDLYLSDLHLWMLKGHFEKLNVAGNRESTNSGIQEFTRTTLTAIVCALELKEAKK